jgi:hypothetical protein
MTWELVGNIRGPAGESGGEIHQQETPLATWTFAHNLGRLPAVAIYFGNELVFAPVSADSTSVSVMFPSPQVGYLILS